ncbi:MAG TPA: ATP-binding protein, partial [Candidatus Sulfotelmatobacter sp.]|nr:ATP-binding protein [Candidatus Sulfotelmatobacter sp.]
HATALHHARQLATVTELTQTLTTLRDPGAVADEIVTAVGVLHPRTIVQLWQWDPQVEILCLVAAAGAPLETHPLRELKAGDGLAGRAFASRAPVLSGDVTTDPRFAAPAWATAERFTVGVALPLLYQSQAHGAFVLLWREPHQVTDEELAALRVFAAHATIGLENARLFRDEQRRREEVEAVRAVTEEMARELDLTAVLRLIYGRAVEFAQGDSGAIYLWDEAAKVLVPKGWHGFGDWMADLRLGLGDAVAGTVAARRQGMLVNDFRSSPYTYPAFVERSSHVAVLGEPLLYRSRLVGVVTITRNDPQRPFTAEDQRLLRLFATQAAIAVENARLFQEQQQAYVKLQEAQEELVRTEKLRALGQMGAGIAHDLNNMLAAVLGQAELLKLQVHDPNARKSLQTLTTAATDGAAVVRRLQDFSRQRSKAPVVPLHLDAVVQDALEITRPRWSDDLQRQGLTIQVTTELAGLPPVLAYGPELREALTNLILNAVDAMPHGGTLRLVGRAASGGEWVDLQIADTGVGIPDAIRPRIFDPFFTTKGPQGTGLGLSVVYAIVERHGGRIEVASTPGHGATFTLRLRRAEADPSEPGPGRRVRTGACRVLVIDDDPLVRETVSTLLRTAGHTVTEASGGTEGIRRLAEAPVDLVLTDLGMPDVTGWDVAREVKARDPRLPVILLTGWGEHAACDQDGSQPGWVDVILSKPVSLDDLLRAVGRLGRRDEASPKKEGADRPAPSSPPTG